MTYGEFLKRVATVFAMAVGLIGFWYLREIFLLAFLSIIITLVLSAPVERMQAAGLSRRSAIIITMAGVIVGLVSFFVWIGPLLFNALDALVSDLPAAYEDSLDYYTAWRLDQSESVQQIVPALSSGPNFDSELQNNLVSGQQVAEFLLPGLGRIGSVVLTVSANVTVIFVMSIFLLIDPGSHMRGILALVPAEYHERTAHILHVLRHTLRNWLTTLSFSMVVTAIMVEVYLGLLLRIPNSLALALIAAVMTVIPNIGAAIPIIPIIIFTLSSDPALLPLAVGGYLVLQQIESNVLTPMFIKSRMQIPPASLFLFQIAATALFGLLGLILAVPLLSTVIAIVRELYVYDTLGFRGKRLHLSLEAGQFQIELQNDRNEPDHIPPMPSIVSDVEPSST